MLKDEIRKRVTAAMKNRDTVEKEILRVALGEIQTEEARGTALDEAGIEKILRKLIKSNRETLEASDVAETKATLERENEILASLLPKTLDEDEVIAALSAVKADVLAAGNDGQATGVAMKHLKGQSLTVDGRTVSGAVRRMRTA